MEEVVHAHGHENVTGTHPSTFEVTRDDHLTPAGDCILAVDADRAPADLDADFVSACRDTEAAIEATLRVGSRTVTVTGRGDPDLSFASDRSLVARTSTYVDDRTVMVGASHAAGDFDRDVVDALAGGAAVELVLAVR